MPVATRFTASQTSSYAISGFFYVQDSGLQSSGNAALLEIITNGIVGNPEFSANSHGAPLGMQYAFSVNNLLTQSETVKFAPVGVGWDVHNLTSGVSVAITPLVTLPTAQPIR